MKALISIIKGHDFKMVCPPAAYLFLSYLCIICLSICFSATCVGLNIAQIIGNGRHLLIHFYLSVNA